MGNFASAQEVYDVIGGLMQESTRDAAMGPKIHASGITIQFRYSDPESVITVDAQSPPPEGQYFQIYFGDNPPIQPAIVMDMTADIAHLFWLGKVNLTAALTRGQMKIKGPLQQVMKLLPAITPAYKLYPEYLKSKGLDHLLPA